VSLVNEFGQPVGDPVDWSPRPAPQPVRLAGRYVVLEPVAVAHAQALFAATRDPALWTYRSDDPPASVAELAARIAGWAAAHDTLTFALLPADTGTAAGVSTLCRLDPANGSAEIGAVLFGQGLARTRAGTEVLRLVAGYLFEDLGYRRFEWKLDSGNAPSAAAARRFGFSYEGRFRNALVYKGRNRDTDWFAMTDDDWVRLAPEYDAWLDPDNFDSDGRQLSRLSDRTVPGP
jgi:RimJ/RimL family protein N-acetyltransferase